MVILGIETSCDETAAALVEDGSKILSNVVTSSLPLHAKTGGIIPEVAAREQVSSMIPVIDSALLPSIDPKDIDAIAVTFGPGLLGSLLIGVETVKTLSFQWNKPLVPVNHLIGHLYSAWLENQKTPKFPLVALIVSGGHTELLFVEDHGKFRHLGGTRDDAAGEAFDKIARLLRLTYPGGPAIEQAAHSGNPVKFNLPRPLSGADTCDFSFSGLKTAVVDLVNRLSETARLNNSQVSDVSASVQEAIVDVLVEKTVKAAENYTVKSIVLGGGVTANQRLREKMNSNFHGEVYFSSPKLSLDNGAMIASAAYFNFKPVAWRELLADAALLF
jgi:N6-L-threonylcarbamoyladenine synthase